MAERLRRCVDHSASRAVYFNDAERSELETLTGGHLINTATEALARIRATVTILAGEVEVIVPQDILARAASRAASYRISTEEWLRRELLVGLERATGMRP